MPSLKLIDKINRDIYGKYGRDISRHQYNRLICEKMTGLQNVALIETFIDMNMHSNEFYIHHSELYKLEILAYDSVSLRTFFATRDLREGVDYICVANNGRPFSEYSNVFMIHKNAYSEINNIAIDHGNWRIFCKDDVDKCIEEYNSSNIKRAAPCYEHYIMSPATFVKLAISSDPKLMDTYMIANSISEGYIMYLKLVIHRVLNRSTSNQHLQTTELLDTRVRLGTAKHSSESSTSDSGSDSSVTKKENHIIYGIDNKINRILHILNC